MKQSSIVLVFLTFLFSGLNNLNAQEKPKEEKIIIDSTRLKNEIGIGISAFIKVIFDSDENQFDIMYKRNFKRNIALRLGFNVAYSSNEDGQVFIGFAPGFERNIKVMNKKWRFYYGSDVSYQMNRFNSNKRTEYIFGFTPFVGVSFKVGKNFSINTEPGILFTYNIFDRGDFLNTTDTSFGIELSRLGTIRLNFHL